MLLKQSRKNPLLSIHPLLCGEILDTILLRDNLAENDKYALHVLLALHDESNGDHRHHDD